jgi:putative ATP-dependent endonuclease of OLD family
MKITQLSIKNFRLLKDVRLSLEAGSTVIVGRNNSGKTSLTELFRRLLSDRKPSFSLYDFNISTIASFKNAVSLKFQGADLPDIREGLPLIEITLTVRYDPANPDLGALSEFIIDLDPACVDVKIRIRYQVGDGKIGALFEGITDDSELSKLQFIKLLKERIPQYYTTEIVAVDPNDDTNFSEVEYTKFRDLVSAGFINAQRGLDDVTHTEKDVLGKVLGKLFRTANNTDAPADLREKSEALEVVINELQVKVDTDLSEKLDALLPAFQIFGYPGLADPNLSTETTLNIGNFLDSNTKIRYGQGDGIFLPETYNGLGSRNLIYMLLQLFEFFRDWQTSAVTSGLYLIFVEEPEAHLHPQMQQVFIKQLGQIADEFSRLFNNSKPWPVQFVVTTHSTHIANEAEFEAIRYFLTIRNEQIETRVKDLRAEFSTPDLEEDREFLHKYLTLTRCDLFFADKAILIEGPTERILMPILVEKTDEGIVDHKLKSQYISIIEVGGAFAHHFFKFLDFLDLRTLIITDLDVVLQTKGDKKTTYPACQVSGGSHSSNAGIKNWFDKDLKGFMSLQDCLAKTPEEKTSGCRRIAYQIPEPGQKYPGRSFEDAFMLANPKLFGIEGADEAETTSNAYEAAEGIGKTDFALEYALDKTDWVPPLYIKEGLEWLSDHPNVIAPATQAEMITVVKEGQDGTASN